MKFLTFSLTALASMAAVFAAPPADTAASAPQAGGQLMKLFVTPDGGVTRYPVGSVYTSLKTEEGDTAQGEDLNIHIFRGSEGTFVFKDGRIIDSNGSDESEGDDERRAMRLWRKGPIVGLGKDGEFLMPRFTDNISTNYDFYLYSYNGVLRLHANDGYCYRPYCIHVQLVREFVN